MRKFVFHLGVTLRSYGNVEIEAESVEAALPMLTADFIGENIAIIETSTDSGQDLAIIDVFDADTDEDCKGYDGRSLPSPYDPKPGAELAPAIETLKWVDAALNWADESQAEMLGQIPAIREMVKKTLAAHGGGND